jgi:hypothetical protein
VIVPFFVHRPAKPDEIHSYHETPTGPVPSGSGTISIQPPTIALISSSWK